MVINLMKFNISNFNNQMFKINSKHFFSKYNNNKIFRIKIKLTSLINFIKTISIQIPISSICSNNFKLTNNLFRIKIIFSNSNNKKNEK